jgi:hypothetical protein
MPTIDPEGTERVETVTNDWCGMYAHELVGMLVQIHLSGKFGENKKQVSPAKKKAWRSAAAELVLQSASEVYAGL